MNINSIELLDDNLITISKIPNTHLEVLEILQKALGNNFYVTGSLSLLLYGVIDRQIKDLDIVLTVGKKKDFYDKIALFLLSSDDTGENESSDNGQSYECTLKINGIKVDVFKFNVQKTPLQQVADDLMTTFGLQKSKSETKHLVIDGFKILEPKPSIDAKLNYIDFFTGKQDLLQQERTNLKKHLLDVSDYYRWLVTKY